MNLTMVRGPVEFLNCKLQRTERTHLFLIVWRTNGRKINMSLDIHGSCNVRYSLRPY